MGLAASQARFLSLTARKSNVEYQGQQINEQRLLLANKSAALQTQMLTLAVPTPPVQTQFMTLTSVVTIDGVDYTISAEDKKTAQETLFSWTSDIRSTGVNDWGDTDNFDTSKYRKCADSSAFDAAGKLTGDIYVFSKVANDSTSGACVNATYMKDGVETTTKLHVAMYVPVGKSEPDGRMWISKNPIALTSTSGPNDAKALFEDGLNNMETKQIEEFDEKGYNDAYNEYKYQQYLYEQQLEEINAKTENIHQQDKTLELQLKQLDTEQSALKTEMDAISKVVKDHVESGFKTFGG